MSNPISDPGLTRLLPMNRDLTEEWAKAAEDLAGWVRATATPEDWIGDLDAKVAHLLAVVGMLRASLSAPEDNTGVEKAVEAAIERLYDNQGEAETEELARVAVAAIQRFLTQPVSVSSEGAVEGLERWMVDAELGDCEPIEAMLIPKGPTAEPPENGTELVRLRDFEKLAATLTQPVPGDGEGSGVEDELRANVREQFLAVADKFESKAEEKFGLTEPGPEFDLWRGEGEAYATASNELRNVAAEVDPEHLDYTRLPLPAALTQPAVSEVPGDAEGEIAPHIHEGARGTL